MKKGVDWSRVPLLLITAALLISGVLQNDVGGGSREVLSVGFVSFGAWMTVEIQTWYQKLRMEWDQHRKEDEPPDA